MEEADWPVVDLKKEQTSSTPRFYCLSGRGGLLFIGRIAAAANGTLW
jgi:hypothetical protein